MRKWRKSHPPSAEEKIKIDARSYLGMYIRRGKLKKLDRCEVCSSDRKIEAHHEDYTKPLSVVWLCRECHVLVSLKKLCIVPGKYPGILTVSREKVYGYIAMQLPKVQMNFKIEADLKGRAVAAAKDAGQQIGIFISRAIEARLGQLAAAETYAATKRRKR